MKHPAYEQEEKLDWLFRKTKINKRLLGLRYSENGVFVEYLPLNWTLNLGSNVWLYIRLMGTYIYKVFEKFIFSKEGLSKTEINPSSIPFRMV